METKVITDLSKIDQFITHYLIPLGWKALGAILAWIFGRFFIRMLQRILKSALSRKEVDHTLIVYALSTSNVALNLLLMLTILGIFGIETTSFSAILAAAGVAIGMAWSGLLSNFAAGVFLILFRPFRVGDTIMAAGVTGTVVEIGLFASSLDTESNVRIFIGNNKLFSENILNYTANPKRILQFKVQLAHEVNPRSAIALLIPALQNASQQLQLENIQCDISEMNTLGTCLSLRATGATEHYSKSLSAGYQLIYDTLQAANFPPPSTPLNLVNHSS